MSAKRLTLVATIKTTEDKCELVKAELIKLIAPTRAEDGCEDYVLHTDNLNPNTFVFYENWSSYEAWQKHMATQHMADFKTATGSYATLSVAELTEVE